MGGIYHLRPCLLMTVLTAARLLLTAASRIARRRTLSPVAKGVGVPHRLHARPFWNCPNHRHHGFRGWRLAFCLPVPGGSDSAGPRMPTTPAPPNPTLTLTPTPTLSLVVTLHLPLPLTPSHKPSPSPNQD